MKADEGERVRLDLFGESYYLCVFKTADGFDFVPTVPRENDPEMSRERLGGGDNLSRAGRGKTRG